MPALIIPIVEGHGDVEAVPVLLRRIAESLGIYDLRIGRPIRCPRHRLLKTGEFERALELAVRKGGGNCRILVLIDAETDCPKELAPELLARAIAARGNLPIAVVLAKREFEAWFLGGIESLRDLSARSAHDFSPGDPESIRGAKERLAELFGAPYSEVIDQPSMAARFDMEQAKRNCPSFDKCWRAVRSLLTIANTE